MAVEAPAPRPGHDENSQGYQQISIFGPIPQDSIAADVFVDFAEKLGHFGLVTQKKRAKCIARTARRWKPFRRTGGYNGNGGKRWLCGKLNFGERPSL